LKKASDEKKPFETVEKKVVAVETKSTTIVVKTEPKAVPAKSANPEKKKVN
jgi:hypothetical protein